MTNTERKPEHEATEPPPTARSTLDQEHALLTREVSTRADAVLTVADKGGWPQQELHELVNYLQLEVLRQIVDEEWLLFGNAHRPLDELATLRGEHLQLRRSIETLTEAAQGAGDITPKQVAVTTRDLLGQLKGHLAAEDHLLTTTTGTATPAVTGITGQPHEWYGLTAGRIIDLDALPGPRGADATLGRLLQLHRGQTVELRGSRDPSPLWQRVTNSDPAGWGITHLERGPDQWRVEISRRGD